MSRILCEINDETSGDSAAAIAEGTTSRSELATLVLQSAIGHQLKASNTRLDGRATTNTTSRGLNSLGKNLTKAQAIKAERKAKFEESKLINIGIKMAATLWSHHHNKLTQVND